MSKQFKFGEPWRAVDSKTLNDAAGCLVGVFELPRDRARASVCVNACAGLDLPGDVKPGAVGELVEAVKMAISRCLDCDGDGIAHTMDDETNIGQPPGSSAMFCPSCTNLRAALAALEPRP